MIPLPTDPGEAALAAREELVARVSAQLCRVAAELTDAELVRVVGAMLRTPRPPPRRRRPPQPD